MTEVQSIRGSIVLIDDEPGVLLALKLVLQTLQFEVHAYSDPVQAVKALTTQQLKPTLVVCDLRMPKINGLGVVRELREGGVGTPFVLISAHASDSERDEALIRGADGFLTKPFTPQEFVKKFEQVARPQELKGSGQCQSESSLPLRGSIT